jgi:preprotein translocase subunit SecE
LKGGFFKKMSKITEYFKETKTELKHVIWPSRRQTLYYTLAVIVLSVIIAYYLGIFDFIFSQILQKIIGV